MEEKKNHWTKKKVEEAKKKINNDIYKRDRQTSIHIKLDNLAIIINNSITRLIIFYQFYFIQISIDAFINFIFYSIIFMQP